MSGFVFDIKGSLPTITTYQNANPSISRVNSQMVLRDGTINVLNENGGTIIRDYSTKHPYSLSIEKVTINQKHGTAPAINISSPTLNKFDIRDVHVKFKKTDGQVHQIGLVNEREDPHQRFDQSVGTVCPIQWWVLE